MKSVLLIDDDEVIRFAVKRVLEYKGEYEVTAVDNGEAGLEIVAKDLPDVVLLDLGMPGMDGIEFLKKCKGIKDAAGLPVVVITGATIDDDRSRELTELADAFLQKPINGQMLKESIEFVTGRRRDL
jgi:CheY-like chemotaxis protein